ncbi:replication endonuclease [Marinomonas aquiplantarum]|uniref:Bacteriophage replication gene A protein n=1 Tax=Marinomonas aquiplantarum TaxID=491951 RepID=A0A366D004_9GAMM|nr:replication endonuclease [Marinomonas aquiplantarum]RBO83410.1 bacteriophage replication gene A protein [Marinomonas aquiplantarum]
MSSTLSYWSRPQVEQAIPPAPAGFMWPYECEQWRRKQLEGLSREDASVFRERLQELDKTKGYIKANAWLSRSVERFTLLEKLAVLRPVVSGEFERLLKEVGNDMAMDWLRDVVKRLHYCDKLITELDGEELHRWAAEKSNYFEVEIYAIGTQGTPSAVKAFIALQLEQVGATFDHWDDNDRVAGLAARMITNEWWVRQAKRQWIVVENVLRECGQVHRYKSPYVSWWALGKAEKQAANNKAFLDGWEAVNDLGQSFTLAELSKKGVSDPDNRFAEMVVRAKGMEEIADELGHDGWFITLTCPSKYHPISRGKRNLKFWRAGSPSVRTAQKYLNLVWRRFRSWCNRHEIPFYGLRTVEPHHDGCPHWHLMLWTDPKHSNDFLRAFAKYALQEDGNEQGAKKHRIKVRKIDKDKGSAVGYIVKYISKNIHGKHVDTDHETGRSGSDAAKRIVSWARLNRIRQFQFLGGASVTVWRELRRLGKDKAPKTFADIYHAANRADFGGFVKLMGGVFAGKNQTLKTHYSEPEENQYGEMVKSVKGVAKGIDVLITRIYEWTVRKKGSLALEDGEAVPWTRVNKCTGPNFGRNYEPTKYGGGGQYVSPG